MSSLASDAMKVATGKQSVFAFATNFVAKNVTALAQTAAGVATEVVNSATAPTGKTTTKGRKKPKSERKTKKEKTEPASKQQKRDFHDKSVEEIVNSVEFQKGRILEEERRLVIFEGSSAAHQKQREEEEDEYLRNCKAGIWLSPRYSPESQTYEKTRIEKCVYKGCVGDGTFEITERQWGFTISKFGLASAPANCNACRKLKAETYERQVVEGGCEICGDNVVYDPKVWDMKRKTEGMPLFQDNCSQCIDQNRLQELEERRFQLVNPATHKGNILHDLKFAKDGGKVFNKAENKAIEKVGGYDKLIQKLSLNYPPSPITDLVSIVDLTEDPDCGHEYHVFRTDGGANTRYEHVESHITGKRKGKSNFNDTSLREVFNSTLDALSYVHYIAGLGGNMGDKDNPVLMGSGGNDMGEGRFYQVNHPDGTISRYDADPDYLLEIHFTKVYNDGNRMVATVYRPKQPDKPWLNPQINFMLMLSEKLP
jgi:hypothetical protein